ncbi:MAG: hypothetical protein ACT4PO_15745 [Actinomycetota bacterium]
MKRRLRFVAAAVALVGIALSSATIVSASSPNITQEETTVLIERTTHLKFTDLGKAGPSPNDLLAFADKLFDETGTTKVGTDHINCTGNFKLFVICSIALDLTGRGQIVVEGAFFLPVDEPVPPFDVAVTGGTGEFENVRGSVHVEFLTQTDTRLTVHLIP